MSLTKSEWEALCNRCGRCCHKLTESGQRHHSITCEHFNKETRLCNVYKDRFRIAPNCRELIEICLPMYEGGFLPEDCAYMIYYKEKNEKKQVD